MINVTRLNRTCLVLNSDLIEFIESAPDTVITSLEAIALVARLSQRCDRSAMMTRGERRKHG